jgi:hypothetical protein
MKGDIAVKIITEERPSDSPFVERIWRSYSDEINTFTSIESNHLDLVVWKYQGETNITLRGPETKATTSPVPELYVVKGNGTEEQFSEERLCPSITNF